MLIFKSKSCPEPSPDESEGPVEGWGKNSVRNMDKLIKNNPKIGLKDFVFLLRANPFHSFVVGVCGLIFGLFLQAFLIKRGFRGFYNFRLLIIIEGSLLVYWLTWYFYSVLLAKLTGEETSRIFRADAYSYLPTFLLLSFAYYLIHPVPYLGTLLLTVSFVLIVIIKAFYIFSDIYQIKRFKRHFFLISFALLASGLFQIFWAKELSIALLNFRLLFLVVQICLVSVYLLWWLFSRLFTGRKLSYIFSLFLLSLLIGTVSAISSFKQEPEDIEDIYVILDRQPEAERIAVFAANQNPGVLRKRITIDNETRNVLFVPAPTTMRHRGRIPPGALLLFGFGLMEEAWERSGDGVQFDLYLEDDSGKRKSLFSKYIDPKHRKEDRRWFDVSVDLSKYSGQNVTLIFGTKGSYPIEPPFKRKPDTESDFSIISNPRITSMVKQGKANIILAVIDALRPDHLGCYGYSRETSLNIDRIAREGVIFTNAISQASWSWPSIASLFTSLYPSQHQVTDIFGYPLKKSLTTLAEILKGEGYITGAISNNAGISKLYQFDQGFDYFNEKCMDACLWKSAECMTSQILPWLEKNYHSPFLLYLHYMDPHAPYNPPSPFKGMLNKSGESDIDRLISYYDGEIRYVDYHLGKLLSKLKELGIDDNTLLIIMADHGEEFLEHGSLAHGPTLGDPTLYEEVIRVPLIFRYPDLFPRGKIVKGVVRSIDIAPIILDVAGIPKFKDMEGVSLLPLLSGRVQDLKLTAFSETGELMGRGKKSLRSSTWKLISDYSSSEIELYDLQNDPDEIHNLAAEEFELIGDLLKIMNNIQKSFTVSEYPSEEKVRIDEETREKLRSLGYIH